MIRILTILIGAVIFAAVFAQLVGYGIMYTVDQTEHAVITRFGNVQSVVSEPGLQFKSPIESVTRFDKRLLRINVPTAAMPDKESLFLEIVAYVRYRISDPQSFLETLRDQDTASSRIGNLAIAALRARSPIIVSSLNFLFSKSLASPKPNPAEIDVELCAAPKGSYSLSVRFVNPESPPP